MKTPIPSNRTLTNAFSLVEIMTAPSWEPDADGDSIELIDAIDFAVISRKGTNSSDLEQKSAAALRVNGFTGQVSIFQPEAGQ